METEVRSCDLPQWIPQTPEQHLYRANAPDIGIVTLPHSSLIHTNPPWSSNNHVPWLLPAQPQSSILPSPACDTTPLLPLTTTLPASAQSRHTVSSNDADLEGVLGCLNSDTDVHDLVSCLMETEGELQSLLEDASLLNLPDIFTDAPISSHHEIEPPGPSTNALVPSVSLEYLRGSEPTESTEIPATVHADAKDIDHTCMLLNHPLLPLLRNLLHDVQAPASINVTETALSFSDIPEADELMLNALVATNTLSEDHHVNKVIREIDQDCDSISQEMSSFCLKILKKSPEKCNASLVTVPLENNSQATNVPSETRTREAPSSSVGKSTKKQPRLKSIHTKKRTYIPAPVVEVLVEWLHHHAHHPYPDDDEKDELCLKTGLTIKQLNNWFINARRRKLHTKHTCRNKQ